MSPGMGTGTGLGLILFVGALVAAALFGFLLGRLSGGRCGTGNAQLDTWLAYLQIHVWNRKEALQLSRAFAWFGLPINITSDGHLASLVAAGSMVLTSLGAVWRFAQRSGMMAAVSSGALASQFAHALD